MFFWSCTCVCSLLYTIYTGIDEYQSLLLAAEYFNNILGYVSAAYSTKIIKEATATRSFTTTSLTHMHDTTPCLPLPRGVMVNGVRQTIEFRLTDDGSDPAFVQAKYQELVADPTVDLLKAPYTTALNSLTVPIVKAANKLQFACCTGTPSLFGPDNGLVSTFYSAALYYTRALQVLRGRGARTVMNVRIQSDFCDAALNTSRFPFVPSPTEQDVQLVDDITITSQDGDAFAPDIARILASVRQYNPDVVLACVREPQCQELAQGIADTETDVTAIVLGACASEPTFKQRLLEPNTPELLQPGQFVMGIAAYDFDAQNDLLLGTGNPDYCTPGLPCWSPRDFTHAFLASFGVFPSSSAATSFANVQLIVQLLMEQPFATPADRLEQLASRFWGTILGVMKFNINGQPVQAPLLSQLLPGYNRSIIVSPAALADGELVVRAPTWEQRKCIVDDKCGDRGSCKDDGSCECDTGFVGATCNVSTTVIIAVPIAIAAVCVACVAIAAQHRRHARHEAARAYAQQARDQALAQRITESTVRKAMTYTLHELANPVHILQASAQFVLETLGLRTAIPRPDSPERGTATLGETLGPHVESLRTAALRIQQVLLGMQLDSEMTVDAPGAVEPIYVTADVMDIMRDIRLRSTRVFTTPAVVLFDEPSVPAMLPLDELRVRQVLLACCARVACANWTDIDQWSPSSPEDLKPLSMLRRLWHRSSTSHMASDQGIEMPLNLGRLEPVAGATPEQNEAIAELHALPEYGLVLSVHTQHVRGDRAPPPARGGVFLFPSADDRMGSPTGPLSRTSGGMLGSGLPAEVVFIIAPITTVRSVLGPSFAALLTARRLAAGGATPRSNGSGASPHSLASSAVSTLARERLLWYAWQQEAAGSQAEYLPARLRAVQEQLGIAHMQMSSVAVPIAEQPVDESEHTGPGHSSDARASSLGVASAVGAVTPPRTSMNMQSSQTVLTRASSYEQPVRASTGAHAATLRQQSSSGGPTHTVDSEDDEAAAQRRALQSFTLSVDACRDVAHAMGGQLYLCEGKLPMAALVIPWVPTTPSTATQADDVTPTGEGTNGLVLSAPPQNHRRRASRALEPAPQ